MTKGEQTRQKIVEAAAPIFNRHGYEGSSMATLMEATGLQKGGIYRHFESKEELAAEAFDYTWQTARHVRLHDLDASAPTVVQLKQLIANFVERKAPIPGGCPLLNTAVDSDDGNALLRARVSKALRRWVKLVEEIVRAAGPSDWKVPTDPADVATVIVAGLEGAIMMGRIQRSSVPLRTVQRHLNAYLDSIFTAYP